MEIIENSYLCHPIQWYNSWEQFSVVFLFLMANKQVRHGYWTWHTVPLAPVASPMLYHSRCSRACTLCVSQSFGLQFLPHTLLVPVCDSLQLAQHSSECCCHTWNWGEHKEGWLMQNQILSLQTELMRVFREWDKLLVIKNLSTDIIVVFQIIAEIKTMLELAL